MLGQEAPVELGRGHVRDNGLARIHRAAALEAHARRTAAADDHLLDVGAGLELAAGVAHDARERLDEADASPLRHRHPAELDRDGDHARHEARRRRVGTEARMQHPGREQSVRLRRHERLGRPSPGS